MSVGEQCGAASSLLPDVKKGKTYELAQSDFFFGDGGVNLGHGDM